MARTITLTGGDDSAVVTLPDGGTIKVVAAYASLNAWLVGDGNPDASARILYSRAHPANGGGPQILPTRPGEPIAHKVALGQRDICIRALGLEATLHLAQFGKVEVRFHSAETDTLLGGFDTRPPALRQDLANRRDAADAALEAYNFTPYSFEGSDGWEHESPGVEWSRSVFLSDPDAPDGDSSKARLTVRFAAVDSADVAEVTCRLDGNDIGCMPDAPAPLVGAR